MQPALENLCGPGKPLKAEAPDANEIAGLLRTGQELLVKADRALASAKLLLDSGDVDGACNRAYYPMFDAARAALLSIEAPVPAEVARTHSGLIAAFSLHLDKSGRIPHLLRPCASTPKPVAKSLSFKWSDWQFRLRMSKLLDNLNFELRHKAIIDRSGRYPHRNALLGRSSSAEELAFLSEPGSSF